MYMYLSENVVENEEQKKSPGPILIILLALSVILNIYQWRNHSTSVSSFEQKVETLVVERVNVGELPA